MGGRFVSRYDFESISKADRARAAQLQTKINRLRKILLRAKADTATLADVRREMKRCHARIDRLEKRVGFIEGALAELRAEAPTRGVSVLDKSIEVRHP